MKNIFTALAFSLMILNVSAQSQIIFDETDKESYLISYDIGQQTSKNTIFNILAKGNSVRAQNIKLTFKLRQNRQILKRSGNLNLIVELNDLSVSGITEYKKFSVENLLIPSKVALRAVLKKGNVQVGEYNIPGANISSGTTRILDISQPDSLLKGTYQLIVRSKDFEYTPANRHAFQNYTGYIDDYWQSAENADQKLRRLNTIGVSEEELEKANEPETIREYYNFGRDNLQFVRTAEEDPFMRELNVAQNDPSDLKTKLQQLRNKSQRLEKNANAILSNLEVFYYNKGLDQIRRSNFTGAQSNFEKAVHENPNFAPAHVQLAKIFYGSGFRENAIEEIFHVQRLNPDPETEQLNNELANGMYNDMLLEASDLNRQGAFEDALFVLSSAEHICREFRAVRCRPAMEGEIMFAVKGKYFVLTENAHAAITAGKMREAEDLIDRAYDYRKKHLKYIPQTEEITGLIYDLYVKHLETGESYNRSSRYENALVSLKEAERICQKYPEAQCDRRLENAYANAYYGIYRSMLNEAENAYNAKNYSLADQKAEAALAYRREYNLKADERENRLVLEIKKGRYEQFISEGNRNKDNGRFEQALEDFKQAKTIEANYGIRRNSQLTAYINSAASGLTLEYTDNGMREVNINDLKTARRYYNKAKNTAQAYNIQNTKEVAEALKNLKDKIFEQECINAQTKFNDYLQKADAEIRQKNFINAEALLGQAKIHADKYGECEIDLSQLNIKSREIAPAVNYQKHVNTAEVLIKRQKYSAALIDYLKAERYFADNNISAFGLSHLSLDDFAQKQNNEFINYIVWYYADKADYDKALNLLRILETNNYAARNTKKNQMYIGTELATRDYSENPNSDRNTNIDRYTRDNWYFRFLKRAYKRQWRQLN
jgi:tetratricopeptide (TPR) repeat protein